MIHLEGYKIIEKIEDSYDLILYRGINPKGKVVFIKQSKNIKDLHHEFAITKSLNNLNIIQPIEIIHYKNFDYIIAHDVKGEPLSALLHYQVLTVDKVLTYAVGICEGLSALHAVNLIHANLNPSGIMINEHTKDVRIIDFAYSVRSDTVSQRSCNYAYLSPEQASNLPVDERSDLYSLGIILYQMLTSTLPFIDEDPHKILLAHQIITPAPIYKRNKNIPRVLSDIIAKLLQKAPEDRYQSVTGLKADLINCLSQLNTHKRIDSFLLASKDISIAFRWPKKLYARDNELKEILNIFKRTMSGSKEHIILLGGLGIGKTALINCLSSQVAKDRGFFIKATCTIDKMYKPYHILNNIVAGLFTSVQFQSQETQQRVKVSALNILAGNRAFIQTLLPSLNDFLGEYTTQEDSHLHEEGMHEIMVSVLKSIFRLFNNIPIFIAIDDMQFIDPSSKELINLVFNNNRLKKITLLCAYEAASQINIKIAKYITSTTIDLLPFNQEIIHQLLSKLLTTNAEELIILSNIIFERSQGIPGRVYQYLLTLYTTKCIYFEANKWRWNIAEIEHTNFVPETNATKYRSPHPVDYLHEAKKAKKIFAYKEALYYLQQLPNANDPVIMLIRVDLEIKTGHYLTAKQMFRQLLPKLQTDAQRMELYLSLMSVKNTPSQEAHAQKLGAAYLKSLAINLPNNEELEQITSAMMAEIKHTLGKRGINFIDELPDISNDKTIMALKVFEQMIDPKKDPTKGMQLYVQLKMLELTLQFGKSELTSRILVRYATILNRIDRNGYQLAFNLCTLALKISYLTDSKFIQAIIQYQYARNMVWVKPLIEVYKAYDEAIALGIRSGNYVSTRAALLYKAMTLLSRGMKLKDVENEIIYAYKQITKYNLINNHDAKHAILFAIEAYSGMLNGLQIKTLNFKNPLVKNWFDSFKIQYFYLHNDITESKVWIANANDILEKESYIYNHFYYAEYVFYYYLTLAQEGNNENTDIMKRQLIQFELWSDACRENFFAMLALMKGEYARLNGKLIDAVNYYNEAYNHSCINGLVQLAALASELQGRIWLKVNNIELSKHYLTRSLYHYKEWGAQAKVDLMLKQYQSLISVSNISDQIQHPLVKNTDIDLSTLMNASHAIAKEISLPKLIDKIMSILVQNLGAQRCVLLLKSNDQLFLEGEFTIAENKTQKLLESIPLTHSITLPISLIQYVYKTYEIKVLDNAVNDHQFRNDTYIISQKPKSILCAPILRKNEIIGIFYFENNLAIGSFTQERLAILNTLAQPTAVAIENARMYKSFASFLPDRFLAQLQKRSVADIKPGDHIQKKMTTMFIGIRDFTHISDQLAPKDTFDLVNKFLSLVNPAIKTNHGFIDKYISDSMMAIFPESPINALNAILKMYAIINTHNLNTTDQNLQFNINIGLHNGYMMLGAVGDQFHMDGTVISDAVNIASRLFSLTKHYNVPVILSESVIEHVSNADRPELRFLGKIRLKGRMSEVNIYELIDANEPKIREIKIQTRDLFTSGLEDYYQHNFSAAAKTFAEILKISPNDKIIELYKDQALKFMKTPPTIKWRGGLKMEVK